MPMPLWWGQINKRVFNKMALKRGDWPVLTHVGRSSGKVYRTPLEVHPVDDGYMFILMYGSGSDWVKNVLAAGTASLEIDGEETELVSPRLVPEDVAWQRLPADTKAPPKVLRVSEFLQVDVRK
jgi:deazaflavin-dependent oxidoreductase (nitroreductase family)